MILIQGAGIAGLTLAGLLEQRGIPYRVVEKATTISPLGAGLVIQPNARAILAELDLEEALREAGCGLSGMSVGPLRHPRKMPFPDSSFALGVHRGELHRMLLSRVPAERILLGTTVKSWRQREICIEVELSNGDALGVERLVAADGLHSAVRRGAGNVEDLRSSGQWCWRTVLPSRPLGTEGLEWVAEGCRLGAIPLGNEQTYLYWVQSNVRNGLFIPPPRRAGLSQWGRAGQALAEALPENLEWLSHPLCDRPVWWGEGAVIAIGDAAHPITPNLGQGAALGMEDAWVLARLLESGRATVARMRALRHKRVQSTRRLSWWVGQVAHWNSPLSDWGRSLAYRWLPQNAMFEAQARFVRDFTETMAKV